MHVVKSYQTSVTLFSCVGECWIYASLQEAVKALGYHWICENVGREFRVWVFTDWQHSARTGALVPESAYRQHRFVMRDDFGNALTGADFGAFRPVYRHRRARLYELWDGESPVPGTGRRRHRHSFRRMRTLNERKQAQVLEASEPAPRAARNASNLPSSWWDVRIAADEDRNWKRQRKTQWKNKRSV